MAKKSEARPGRNGTINYYDKHGRKIGRSEPNHSGGYNHYDSKGRKTGQSRRTLSGSYNHYDNHGKKTGRSDPNIGGGYTHRDSHGKRTGSSEFHPLSGSYTYSGSFRDQPASNDTHRHPLHYKLLHRDRQGCYVATCVYGSYDCPQVWTLRCFRDNTLARTRLGRCFIHTYYAISPTIVKWFGNTHWFQSLWRSVLNRIVAKLQHNGVKDTPYKDRRWR